MVKTLGQRVRELREEADFSLRELARKLDKSPAYISDIELGRRHPSAEVLAAIARVLDTSVESLAELDSRAPIRELRRISAQNPAFGLALRRMVDSKVTPEELMKLVERSNRKGDQ